jgi:hypothetical protein
MTHQPPFIGNSRPDPTSFLGAIPAIPDAFDIRFNDDLAVHAYEIHLANGGLLSINDLLIPGESLLMPAAEYAGWERLARPSQMRGFRRVDPPTGPSDIEITYRHRHGQPAHRHSFFMAEFILMSWESPAGPQLTWAAPHMPHEPV